MEELQQYFHDEESEEVVISLETFKRDQRDQNDEHHAILEAILYASSLPKSIGVDFERLLNFTFDLGRKYEREKLAAMAPTACRITVPNLSAAELVQLAQEKLVLTYLDGDLAKWDFITDECGKTYEVRFWTPGRGVAHHTNMRKDFKDGFVGNTAAFIALMMRDNPEGYHASVPEVTRLFQDGDRLCPPRFFRNERHRKLSLNRGHRCSWWDQVCFWAFREVK
jgi:hypothetical protein